MKKRGLLGRQRKAQMQMSFGMIFSIVLIVVIISVGAYVIVKFLRLGKCGEIGLFYNDLKEETDKAWRATIYSDVFAGKLPSGIESVCFGDLNHGYRGEHEEQYEFLSRYRRQDKNVFLYPTQEACNTELALHKLEHVDIEEFFCADAINGEIKIKMEKGQFDALVKLSRG